MIEKEKIANLQYLCSAEKDNKVVDITFRSNRYSVLEYKNEQEKLGRNVSVSAIDINNKNSFAKEKIIRKCDTTKLKFPKRKGWSVRVLCLETGQIYNSIRDFQTINDIGNWVVRKVVYEGRTFKGRHYKIIDEEVKK